MRAPGRRTRARQNFGFGLLKSCLTFGYLPCSVRSKKIPHSTLMNSKTDCSNSSEQNSSAHNMILVCSASPYVMALILPEGTNSMILLREQL